MRAPRRFGDWGAWRAYHRAVWVRFLKTTWISPLVLVLYAAQMAFDPGPVLGLILWFCGLVLAGSVGARLAHLYRDLDDRIGQQLAWRMARDHMRAKMIEDGVPPEAADAALWQADLDLDRIRGDE